MNTTGCSTLFLAAAALVVGFIPILGWINLFIALPLAIVGVLITGNSAKRLSAQPADKAVFWFAVAILATIVLRMVVL